MRESCVSDYRIVCACVFVPFKLPKRLTDIHQTWYERRVIRGQLSVITYTSMASKNNMADARGFGVRATSAPLDGRSVSDVAINPLNPELNPM